jgi:opacity protein-like surface antigen
MTCAKEASMRVRGKSLLTIIALAGFLATPVLAQDRDTGFEFGFDVNYLLGDDVDFEGGSVADVDDDWGFAVSFGYRFNPNFELQTTIDWSDVDYDATLVRADLPGSLAITGTMETFTLMAKGVYNFMDGPVTPFLSAGLGWSWIDTNIPTGSVQIGCWWDPWWGQICAPYQNTKSVDGFRYSGGLGLRWDLTDSLSFRGSWEMHWIDLSNANGTPNFQQIKVGLTWRY